MTREALGNSTFGVGASRCAENVETYILHHTSPFDLDMIGRKGEGVAANLDRDVPVIVHSTFSSVGDAASHPRASFSFFVLCLCPRSSILSLSPSSSTTYSHLDDSYDVRFA